MARHAPLRETGHHRTPFPRSSNLCRASAQDGNTGVPAPRQLGTGLGERAACQARIAPATVTWSRGDWSTGGETSQRGIAHAVRSSAFGSVTSHSRARASAARPARRRCHRLANQLRTASRNGVVGRPMSWLSWWLSSKSASCAIPASSAASTSATAGGVPC